MSTASSPQQGEVSAPVSTQPTMRTGPTSESILSQVAAPAVAPPAGAPPAQAPPAQPQAPPAYQQPQQAYHHQPQPQPTMAQRAGNMSDRANQWSNADPNRYVKPLPKVISPGGYEQLAGGLCDCCNGQAGCYTCCFAYVAPDFAAAEVGDYAGKAKCTTVATAICLNNCGCACVNAAVHAHCISKKIRADAGMEEAFLRDCVFHWCCRCCAVAQELRFVTAAKELQMNAALSGQTVAIVGAPNRQVMM